MKGLPMDQIYVWKNEHGDEVTSLDMVTSVTVTASGGAKRSNGDYGSNDTFASQSLTATIPYGIPGSDVRIITAELYEVCRQQVAQRIGDRLAAMPKQKGEAPPEESYTHASAAPDQELTDTSQYPLVNFRSAKEREPGQRYRIAVNRFEVDGVKIQFFGEGSKYSKLSHYTDRDDFRRVFGDWLPTKSGNLPKDAILTIEVLDKKRGDYYDQTIISTEWAA
jgi:hypothetical protein